MSGWLKASYQIFDLLPSQAGPELSAVNQRQAYKYDIGCWIVVNIAVREERLEYLEGIQESHPGMRILGGHGFELTKIVCQFN